MKIEGEPLPGFCPTCWAKEKATPLVQGRCWWCAPMTEAERAARAPSPVAIAVDEEDVVDVDV